MSLKHCAGGGGGGFGYVYRGIIFVYQHGGCAHRMIAKRKFV